jgi:hypothetical protein
MIDSARSAFRQPRGWTLGLLEALAKEVER